MLWMELTADEIKVCAAKNYTVIIPCGAIEQHGPHLPVDTDCHIALELSKKISESYDQLLVAPPINIGFSPHHLNIHGTISYSFSTFAFVLYDICRSIMKSGFKKIVILNSHGGNSSLLQARSLGLLEELNISILVINYMDFIKENIQQIRDSEIGGISHACELETSLELYFRPELVKKDQVVKRLAQPLLSYLKKDMVMETKGFLPIASQEVGPVGDPTVASAEKGEKFVKAIIEKVGKAIVEFRDLELL